MSSSPIAEAPAASPASRDRPASTGADAVAAPTRRAGLVGALLPLLCFAYLAAPGHPLAVLRGIPLDPWGLTLAGGLAIAFFGFGLPRPGRIAAGLLSLLTLLLMAKVALWSSAPTYGLAASYFSRARIGGVPERSTESGSAPYTRIEAGPGEDGFGLGFFNDVERFNYYEQGQPDRQVLPFAVRWDGHLHVPAGGPYPFELVANGASVLYVDGQPQLTVAAGGGPADRAALQLAAGTHSIRIDYIHAAGPAPQVAVAWDRGGGLEPLGPPHLTVEPADAAWLGRDAFLSRVALGVDWAFVFAVLALMIGLVMQRGAALRMTDDVRMTAKGAAHRMTDMIALSSLLERPGLALFLLAVFAYALVSTRELYGRTVILEGGQDWLTYESYARDILLDGPLMTLGEPLGEGKPFFFQPFYPYYLAALHWLTGEGLWGPIVLQLSGLGVCGVTLAAIARRLFGTPAAVATLGLFLVLFWTQLDWVARKLLSENLYFVVLPAAILLLLRFLDRRGWGDLALAGLLLGVATVTRAPTLLYVPPAALIVAAVLRREGAALRTAVAAAGTLLLLTAAIVALVPLRNYVVSGRPALVATNGGATMLLAHPPTANVRLARVDDNRFYNWLKLDRPTRVVLEFIRQDPAGYAATLVPLGLYALGFSGAVEGTTAVAPEILGLTVLYLAALVLLPSARSLRAGLLHLFVAIHFLTMMVFLPYVYGYRQVLPMQLLVLVFAGALLARALAVGGRGSGVGDRRIRPLVPNT